MVFSSLPVYLDASNWQQLPNHQRGGGIITNTQLPPPQPHVGGGLGSIRPGSMAERARLANIPMPEAALKCPRCDSTNTKFCYFNNYSLSQPRHFCKTCRRYWTRGGALRNVPVGGGCRRNKRSKSSGNNKGSAANGNNHTTSATTNTVSSNAGAVGPNLLGLTPQVPSLRYLSPLGQLTDHFSAADINLSYTGILNPAVTGGTTEMNFPVGGSFLNGGTLISPGFGIESWRLPPQVPQQYPNFLGGLEIPYQFQNGGSVENSSFVVGNNEIRPKFCTSVQSNNQVDSVKGGGDQGNQQEVNLSRQFSGNDQWNGNAWTDLSSLSTSSH